MYKSEINDVALQSYKFNKKSLHCELIARFVCKYHKY